MTKKYLAALVLLLAACGGKQLDADSGASDTLALKKAAAEAAANVGSGVSSQQPNADVCTEHRWYGDGACDSFCAKNDSDCVPNGASTVCAEFIEVEDGKCGRSDDDPCRFQDPDCSGQTPPSAGTGNGTVCAAISEVSDGQCKRPETDPCRFQDPDCVPTTGNGSSGDPGTGVGCPLIAEVGNGKCERPASDPCRSIDPDCDVACLEYIEEPDGVCKRDAYDPCISQDPDCKAK